MELLRQMTLLMEECGEVFSKSEISTRDEAIKIAERIKGYESKCDDVLHEILVSLYASFITPIDQEDIIVLSEKLDDIVDQMEEMASYFEMSNFTMEDKYITEFKNCIGIATKELSLAVNALVDKKLKVIRDHLVKVKSNEEYSDNNVRKAIHDLFSNYSDPIKIIKLKDIYEMLEGIIDATENAAKTLDIIVMKNL
jgi:predicted phosphate transport protein (TIGR00153 family)